MCAIYLIYWQYCWALALKFESPLLLFVVVRYIPLMVQAFSGHSSQCSMTGITKAYCMCCPVCGMVHLKDPMLLKRVGHVVVTAVSSLTEWSITVRMLPYNHQMC